jgi:hypothetical protein
MALPLMIGVKKKRRTIAFRDRKAGKKEPVPNDGGSSEGGSNGTD